MATEPITDALYRALRSSEPDPDWRSRCRGSPQPGQPESLDAISVQITEFKVEMDVRLTRLEATAETRFAEVKSEIKTQTSRIDVLQRVVWPLIGLLATTVFGLLYKAATG